MPKIQLQTLTEQMFYVLLALNQERNGAEIVEYIRQLTNNRIIIGPGTLYAMLSKFEDEKMILETKSEGRKRWYLISEKGKIALNEEIIRLEMMLNDAKEVR